MQINLQLTCLPKSQQPPSQMILMAQKHFGRALLLFRKNLTMLLNLIQQQTPQRSSNLDPINNRSLTSKEKSQLTWLKVCLKNIQFEIIFINLSCKHLSNSFWMIEYYLKKCSYMTTYSLGDKKIIQCVIYYVHLYLIH